MLRRLPGPVTSLMAGIASSCMLVLSFPPYDLHLFAFAAFVPLFLASWEKRAPFPLLWHFITGLLYYAFLLQWTGKFHYLSVPFISVVSGFLFFALPLWIAGKLLARTGPAAGFLIVPSLWIVAEYLKTLGPLSFAFGIVGYSQYGSTGLIQAADIFGVFGISFFIIFINYSLYYSIRCIMEAKSPGGMKRVVIPLAAAVIMALFFSGYGLIKMREPAAGGDLRVLIVQTDHDSTVSWLSMKDLYLAEYRREIAGATGGLVDLAVLPENSVKTYLSLDKDFQPPGSTEILNAMSGMAREGQTALLFGGLEAGKKGNEVRSYNSAFLFNARGDLTGRYRKRMLVPFGETDPFKGLFPWTDRLLLTETGAIRLRSGTAAKTMILQGRDGREYRFGVAICFEGTNGGLLRSYALEGADFIVNITSDRWTNSMTALRQHAMFSVFRAIETRAAVIRCGNGGISEVITPQGTILRELTPFRQESLSTPVPVMKKGAHTVYARTGDWIVGASLLIIIISVAVAAGARFTGKKPFPPE